MKRIKLLFLLSLGINSYGQAAGNGVTDNDGHTYNSVVIGTQEWTKENLNVSTYTDGTPIPQYSSSNPIETGSWTYYNNDPSNEAIYGKLYNWYAIAGIYDDASLANPALRKKLAPTGWHVPANDEWSTLTTYLGSAAGGKMKQTGDIIWMNPNTGATNSSNFTGLPGGIRLLDFSGFSGKRYSGEFWSITESINDYVCARTLGSQQNYVTDVDYYSKFFHLSVRCIKGQALSVQNSTSVGQIKIYPNPTHSILNLSVSTGILLEKVTIVDITGKVVVKQTKNLSTINVEQLAKGVYVLNAYAGDKKYQEKFIKE